MSGRYLHSQGYVVVRTGPQRWELEHRVVMSKAIGRPLTRLEVVHHVNEIRTDNRIENLVLCASPGRHLNDHHPRAHAPWLGKKLSALHRQNQSKGQQRRRARERSARS